MSERRVLVTMRVVVPDGTDIPLPQLVNNLQEMASVTAHGATVELVHVRGERDVEDSSGSLPEVQ